MGAIASYVSTRGLKDGLLRGRRLWTVLGAIVWVARILIRMGSRRPVVVAREVLAPGQSITVTSIDRSAE